MKSIHVTIFCDEVKNQKINDEMFNVHENWDYIGVCIVPTEKLFNLVNELNNLRCPTKNYLNCNNNCKFHEKNKKKIHYQDYSDTICFQTADRWCDVILNNTIQKKDFFIHILGINVAKIDRSFFKTSGEKTNIENNIYNRFFRTSIKYSLKSFFDGYDAIIVDNIFHDTGNMEYHPYFKKQPLRKLKEEIANVYFNCKEVSLIETNNKNCMETNQVILQLIDLFLGATLNCLHATGKKNKKKIALKLFPIIDRCINSSSNPNSRYAKIYSISFFPKNKIDENDDYIEKLIKWNDNFYVNREIKLSEVEQLSLF